MTPAQRIIYATVIGSCGVAAGAALAGSHEVVIYALLTMAVSAVVGLIVS
jgi:hypothetical protein